MNNLKIRFLSSRNRGKNVFEFICNIGTQCCFAPIKKLSDFKQLFSNNQDDVRIKHYRETACKIREGEILSRLLLHFGSRKCEKCNCTAQELRIRVIQSISSYLDRLKVVLLMGRLISREVLPVIDDNILVGTVNLKIKHHYKC